jgi:hypothetical protein
MRVFLIAVACSALALAGPALAARPAPPALRLVMTQPLTVWGLHFKSHERVRVTEQIGMDKRLKLVRASATGAFKVTFAAPIVIDPCLESVRVTAVGARGSDAAVKLPQRACPPSP